MSICDSVRPRAISSILAPKASHREVSIEWLARYQPTPEIKVGYLYVGDHRSQISQATLIYFKNGIELFKKEKAAWVIMELDTPGGELFAAQKISSMLKELDTQFDIPVVAFINNWAISAGALLAYSSRTIAITKDASMGAAEPITSTGEKTSEKVHSAIRADFANTASFYGRNPLIAEAMVDADILLVMRAGQIVRLEKEDQIEPGDIIVSRKDKLLTLNAQEMMQFKVADLLLEPERLAAITAEEKNRGRWPASKMLLFTSPDFKPFSDATIISYQMDWKTRFLSFLANPIVASILFLVLMIAGYVEFNTPGFGLAGGLGLAALFLILLSSFATEAASWLEVIFLIAGIGLILLEIFVLPTFGIGLFVGILLAAIGLFGLLLPGLREFRFDFDTHTFNAAAISLFERAVFLALALVIGFIIIAILSRYIAPTLARYSPFVLRGEQDKSRGYVAGPAYLPQVGSSGIAFTFLRPAGKVEIESELYDATSSGKFIDRGCEIVVVAVDGNRLVVEEKT